MNPQETPQLTPMQRKAVGRKLLEAEIIARAWADDAFRETLETDPVSALTAAGLPLPEGKTIRVIAETPGTVTLILPARPVEGEEVDDKDLAAVAGGRRRERIPWRPGMPGCPWGRDHSTHGHPDPSPSN